MSSMDVRDDGLVVREVYQRAGCYRKQGWSGVLVEEAGKPKPRRKCTKPRWKVTFVTIGRSDHSTESPRVPCQHPGRAKLRKMK